MIENISVATHILFGAATIAIIVWYYRITKSNTLLIGAVLWTAFVSTLGWSGFFQDLHSMPPKIFIGIFPIVLLIIVLFNTRRGRAFIDGLDLEQITYANVIRVPVEITLAMLAHQGAISTWQTFEGANFDIIAGLTAPIVAYLFFTKKMLSRSGFLVWNIVCLLLLITIIVISVLALPTDFQQIGFEQPNRAIIHFPYNLLPMVIVPFVFFGHLVAIRRWWKGKLV